MEEKLKQVQFLICLFLVGLFIFLLYNIGRTFVSPHRGEGNNGKSNIPPLFCLLLPNSKVGISMHEVLHIYMEYMNMTSKGQSSSGGRQNAY